MKCQIPKFPVHENVLFYINEKFWSQIISTQLEVEVCIDTGWVQLLFYGNILPYVAFFITTEHSRLWQLPSELSS
jgi:hypothetical protein